MKVVRIIALVSVAVAACSPAGGRAGTPPPSTTGPATVMHTTDPAVIADCVGLVRAYQTWSATSEWTWDDPVDTAALRDSGEAFLGELDSLGELPTGELAGALSTYIEELETLLTGYDIGERPDTSEVALAADVVTEQARSLAEEACP